MRPLWLCWALWALPLTGPGAALTGEQVRASLLRQLGLREAPVLDQRDVEGLVTPAHVRAQYVALLRRSHGAHSRGKRFSQRVRGEVPLPPQPGARWERGGRGRRACPGAAVVGRGARLHGTVNVAASGAPVSVCTRGPTGRGEAGTTPSWVQKPRGRRGDRERGLGASDREDGLGRSGAWRPGDEEAGPERSAELTAGGRVADGQVVPPSARSLRRWGHGAWCLWGTGAGDRPQAPLPPVGDISLGRSPPGKERRGSRGSCPPSWKGHSRLVTTDFHGGSLPPSLRWPSHFS